MAYYVRYFSEFPRTYSISRRAKKGELRKFDSLVDARRYGASVTTDGVKGGVAMIYSKNVNNYAYAINSPLENPDFVGFVFLALRTDQHYFSIPDHKDRNTGEIHFRSRPIYKNGKLAGKF